MSDHELQDHQMRPIRDEQPLYEYEQIDQLRSALQALYDASPTSCEDKALIDAQRQAEKVLGISR